MSAPIRPLQRLRRRFTLQSFSEKLAACALAAGGVLVLRLAGQTFIGQPALGVLSVLIWSGATIGAALVWTWATRLSLAETAARIDALAATRDRFSSALAFAAIAAPTAMHAAAREECACFIRDFDARAFTRWRCPHELPWLLVPATTAVLLFFWHAQLASDASAIDPRARQELVEKADALDQIARQMEAAPAPASADELKKIAAEFRQSAARLRDPALLKTDAKKAALGELSTLQATLEKMRADASAFAALTDVLQKLNETRQAAAALRAGDLRSAAEALDAALPQASQIAAAMPVPVNAQSDLAKAMAALAHAAGSTEQARTALQKLAAALRLSASAPARAETGGPALSAALNALQEMKFGQPGRALDSSGKSSGSETKSPILMQNFARTGVNAPPATALVSTGRAGSEHDLGTTKNPFGAAQKPIAAEHPALDLPGVLGAGGSLQQLVTTQGDNSKAAQRYRELYEAMAPNAEDTVWQENIPLGSRFFVKRYFESIRPPE